LFGFCIFPNEPLAGKIYSLKRAHQIEYFFTFVKFFTMQKPEILSPAGSYESLHAGIQGGCDAIYFGIEQLNMRAKSTVNFTTDDLQEIARICKENNVKSYITLNTILYDHDISLMKNIINTAKSAGIDAVIASDHAVMSYCRKVAMPVHISTQSNITNLETIEFYADYADVMVLSRELTLMQVADICKNIERKQIKGVSGENIKVEIFAHGALCMAVSGKCYLSLHSHNSSANRGACIQNCRHTYIVTDKEDNIELEIDNEYIMSAKDLCTIDFLDKVVQAGVSVLKIEGRGRAPEYVYTTTKCYREALDSIADGSFSPEKVLHWKEELSKVFNRGFWDGYYLGRKMGEWSSEHGSVATKKKIYLGKGRKYFDKIAVGEFEIETHALNVGDEILITSPHSGVFQTTVTELRKDDQSVANVVRGDIFTMPIAHKIRNADKLYKVVNS
jgi:putative protease